MADETANQNAANQEPAPVIAAPADTAQGLGVSSVPVTEPVVEVAPAPAVESVVADPVPANVVPAVADVG